MGLIGKAGAEIVSDVTGAFNAAGERKQEARELADAPMAAQRRLNEADQRKGFFYSGWRPAAAWVCVLYMTGWLASMVFPQLGLNQDGLMKGISYVTGLFFFLAGARQWDKHFGTDTKQGVIAGWKERRAEKKEARALRRAEKKLERERRRGRR